MGVNDDVATLVQDLGTTREALLDATFGELDDIGGTIHDLVRRLRADAWRASGGRHPPPETAQELAREVSDLVRDHMSALAVLRALGAAAALDGDADSSLLHARLEAGLLALDRQPADSAARATLQAALDRVDRYAVAVAIKLGRQIPDDPR